MGINVDTGFVFFGNAQCTPYSLCGIICNAYLELLLSAHASVLKGTIIKINLQLDDIFHFYILFIS